MGIFRRDNSRQLSEPDSHVRVLRTEEEIQAAREQMEAVGPSDELRKRWTEERGHPDLPPDTSVKRQR